jgi:excisionase family DNA binding protein
MTVWHTVKTGAAHAKVSADLVRSAVIAGDLQAFAIGTGRDYRLREEDIDAWMTSRSYEPRSA